ELLGQSAKSRNQPRGESKHLDFLCRFIAGSGVAEVIELAPLRCPPVKQRVFGRSKVRFTQKSWVHRNHEQQEQKRAKHQERGAEGDQRDEILRHGQKHVEQSDAAGCLASGALQLIVELWVLEVIQIEPRRVLHQANAGDVRKLIAEQTF